MRQSTQDIFVQVFFKPTTFLIFINKYEIVSSSNRILEPNHYSSFGETVKTNIVSGNACIRNTFNKAR